MIVDVTRAEDLPKNSRLCYTQLALDSKAIIYIVRGQKWHVLPTAYTNPKRKRGSGLRIPRLRIPRLRFGLGLISPAKSINEALCLPGCSLFSCRQKCLQPNVICRNVHAGGQVFFRQQGFTTAKHS